jgi:CheY-like chemotaxis protein
VDASNIMTASNGLQAVNQAQKIKFDLILMDLNMPVMDGFTATQLIRQNGLKCYIVAVSAS